MAPPLADIPEEEVAELALKGAKNAEIAAFFGVDEATIGRRFAKLLTKKRSIRRMHLRGIQTDKALSGDTTMLIWLGKNELDQTDKVEQQHSGGVTIKVEYEDVEPGAAESDTPQSRPSPLL